MIIKAFNLYNDYNDCNKLKNQIVQKSLYKKFKIH